ncbi:9365_t:CDS:2 [Cetraspora pellucida]|uniref:9365_t:CDS:1 n=1 Tax=Cetraspora pellucida TaxID=1433469 RepID=A0A9N9HKH2_9GLOM|nr:9365_t:CDS:2 [Cetraspora pellucida]
MMLYQIKHIYIDENETLRYLPMYEPCICVFDPSEQIIWATQSHADFFSVVQLCLVELDLKLGRNAELSNDPYPI